MPRSTLADMKVRKIKIEFYTHTHTEGCHILLPTEFWTLKDGKYPGDNDEKVLDCYSQKYQKAFLSLKVCGKSSIK